MRRITDKDVIGALRDLAANNGGRLKAESVVEAARDPESPLHSRFTWDDSEAAEQWRLQEAQRLIRVVVEYLPTDKTETPVRVFVSLKKDRADGSGYRRTVDVMSDDEMRAQLLADAVTDMDAFKERYRRVQELTEVFAAMDRVTTEQRGQRKEKLSA
jgi:hypothetical protein